ncbi:uncharacterized protein An07g02850 [Aspergillus niger]|uniref:Contig An07c0080, genomic contig n=2 Tax=Aspergillus niger TaxID=5061 RepID=A2QMP5_ASPNC|nr:uncharacterized protein An07g02850 [Aspergillus niger]CAL00219.1 unnamed protein product [Aspergillus niger]
MRLHRYLLLPTTYLLLLPHTSPPPLHRTSLSEPIVTSQHARQV